MKQTLKLKTVNGKPLRLCLIGDNYLVERETYDIALRKSFYKAIYKGPSLHLANLYYNKEV